MADPISALLVVAAASTAGRAVAQVGASEEKLKSLDLMKEQHVLQHQQKTLANFETMQKVLDTQIAQATTRGVGLGSASLEAIRRNTINTGAKEQSNLDIEENIFERNVKSEKSNVQDTLFAELFGDVASLASDFATAKSKIA